VLEANSIQKNNQENNAEEKEDFSPRVDQRGRAATKDDGEGEGRREEDCEVIEAHTRCDHSQSSEIGYFTLYPLTEISLGSATRRSRLSMAGCSPYPTIRCPDNQALLTRASLSRCALVVVKEHFVVTAPTISGD
jgi:hypothetical protein